MKDMRTVKGLCLVPAYGFVHRPSSLSYHKISGQNSGLYPLLATAKTYVPITTPDALGLNYMVGALEPTDITLRPQAHPFPPDAQGERGLAHHTCIMVEGPGFFDPPEWSVEAPCYTAWSWNDRPREFHLVARSGDRKFFSGRLGLGIIYAEVNRRGGFPTTFDYIFVDFLTLDKSPHRDDVIRVTIRSRVQDFLLSELQLRTPEERALFERARKQYHSHFAKRQ